MRRHKTAKRQTGTEEKDWVKRLRAAKTGGDAEQQRRAAKTGRNAGQGKNAETKRGLCAEMAGYVHAVDGRGVIRAVDDRGIIRAVYVVSAVEGVIRAAWLITCAVDSRGVIRAVDGRLLIRRSRTQGRNQLSSGSKAWTKCGTK